MVVYPPSPSELCRRLPPSFQLGRDGTPPREAAAGQARVVNELTSGGNILHATESEPVGAIVGIFGRPTTSDPDESGRA